MIEVEEVSMAIDKDENATDTVIGSANASSLSSRTSAVMTAR
jgi:hypothetical protein